MAYQSEPSFATDVARPRLFLRPGEYIVAASPTQVATVLGSCVSVCIWNPTRGYGAVNHFLLPLGGAGASDSSWRALEGTRFIEEREFFTGLAGELSAIGWRRAARAARLHLSSRLNAAMLLPRAWRTGQHQGVRNLREHVFTRPGGSDDE